MVFMGYYGMKTSIQGFNFFFNDTATTEIYTLSLHDALPICCATAAEVVAGAAAGRKGAGRMVRTSIGCRAPATQRNRMKAVSENEALLLRVVLRSLQNDPSQAAAVVLGGDSRRASTHRRAAPGGAPWSAGRRRCTSRLRRPHRTSPRRRRARTRPPGWRRAPAGCVAPAAPQAVAWAEPLTQAYQA